MFLSQQKAKKHMTDPNNNAVTLLSEEFLQQQGREKGNQKLMRPIRWFPGCVKPGCRGHPVRWMCTPCSCFCLCHACGKKLAQEASRHLNENWSIHGPPLGMPRCTACFKEVLTVVKVHGALTLLLSAVDDSLFDRWLLLPRLGRPVHAPSGQWANDWDDRDQGILFLRDTGAAGTRCLYRCAGSRLAFKQVLSLPPPGQEEFFQDFEANPFWGRCGCCHARDHPYFLCLDALD